MDRTAGDFSTTNSIDEPKNNQLCVQVSRPNGDIQFKLCDQGDHVIQIRRRRNRKQLQSSPYPKWTFDNELDKHTHALLDRLALVQSSLSCRSRPQPQLSPISRLPSELLASIFLHAIEAPPLNNVLPSQFIIASVCKAWRTVAFSTPEYWGRLYVSPLMPVSVYETLLARSSPFPLYVQFFLWRPFKRKQYVSSNEPILERLLDTLKSEKHRLRFLSMQTSNCSWTARALMGSWINKNLVDPEPDSPQPSDLGDW